jgi:hypothetical protein
VYAAERVGSELAGSFCTNEQPYADMVQPFLYPADRSLSEFE